MYWACHCNGCEPGAASSGRGAYREVHLEDYIETRLSDGLTALAPSEADGVVIAGMGGALTKRILAEHPEVWKKMNNLVLQPQSEIEEVRRYIYAEGFHIEEEDMVEEEGKYYVMLRCVPGKAAPLTDVAFPLWWIFITDKK